MLKPAALCAAGFFAPVGAFPHFWGAPPPFFVTERRAQRGSCPRGPGFVSSYDPSVAAVAAAAVASAATPGILRTGAISPMRMLRRARGLPQVARLNSLAGPLHHPWTQPTPLLRADSGSSPERAPPD